MAGRCKPRVVALVQARMGSTRLPGKVLRDLAGATMLEHVVGRLRRATTLDEVVTATSVLPADDAVADLCRRRNIACFRGSEADVLERFLQAARAFSADVVVRITADCPLIDPAVVDEVVGALLSTPDCEYASNVLPRRTYPRGLDAEAFYVDLLERLDREDKNPAWRQHVTEMVFQQPERFRIFNVVASEDLSRHRWTVDTAEDFALAAEIFAHFGSQPFGLDELPAFLDERPALSALNAHVVQKAPF